LIVLYWRYAIQRLFFSFLHFESKFFIRFLILQLFSFSSFWKCQFAVGNPNSAALFSFLWL
jgi:hypothetical protein